MKTSIEDTNECELIMCEKRTRSLNNIKEETNNNCDHNINPCVHMTLSRFPDSNHIMSESNYMIHITPEVALLNMKYLKSRNERNQ